jgi:hypothetical protein
MDSLSNPVVFPGRFRVHILIFLLALLAALTFAHPAFFFNDEWITGNQLAQLKEGHQPFINEGKYGTFQNGTSTTYFTIRNNYLGYSLLFPIVSLPAAWLVDLFGDNFIFFITYLWTFLLLALALFLNSAFPEYTYVGKRQWTPVLYILAFALFFLNLQFYRPFPLSGAGALPEIMAIVLTNVLLFACLAVIVYEICIVIFRDTHYAIFSTVTSLSCSSYLFWTTTGKDHVLVAFLLSIILLMVIRFLIGNSLPSLAGGFFFAGVLIWARPELGIFISIALCCITGYHILFFKKMSLLPARRIHLIISPLFTLLGAIPFFINNYLASKNIFIPAFVLTRNGASLPDGPAQMSLGIPGDTTNTIYALLQTNELTSMTPLSSFPSDLFGIFFTPQSGSMGVIPLIPVFLIGVLVLPSLWKKKHNLFSERELLILGTLVLVSIAVFGAYINRTYGLNTDLGILPDIRYLSPVYLPLTIIGMMVFKKIPPITDKPLELLKGMAFVWMVLIPLSFILIFRNQLIFVELKNVFALANHWFTAGIFITSAVFLILFYYSVWGKRLNNSDKIMRIVFVFLCALPLVWQLDTSFIFILLVHENGGYFFWLPILLKLFNVIAV